ncbi:MAG: hypothetical protein EA428_05505 [Spirochaetaceae bacterium]|nr:MAG: hypothetical protein EA428_05505 [Spirochaetaceae bacterium]
MLTHGWHEGQDPPQFETLPTVKRTGGGRGVGLARGAGSGIPLFQLPDHALVVQLSPNSGRSPYSSVKRVERRARILSMDLSENIVPVMTDQVLNQEIAPNINAVTWCGVGAIRSLPQAPHLTLKNWCLVTGLKHRFPPTAASGQPRFQVHGNAFYVPPRHECGVERHERPAENSRHCADKSMRLGQVDVVYKLMNEEESQPVLCFHSNEVVTGSRDKQVNRAGQGREVAVGLCGSTPNDHRYALRRFIPKEAGNRLVDLLGESIHLARRFFISGLVDNAKLLGAYFPAPVIFVSRR